MASLKSFASVDRFIAEIASPATLRPAYILLGDEVFLYDRCRKAVLATLAPEESRDFCLHDLDLAETSIFEVLDRAQTPSLMAPFQVLFVRNLKTLYGRGSKKEEPQSGRRPATPPSALISRSDSKNSRWRDR